MYEGEMKMKFLKKQQKKKKQNLGFSLVELMVVLAIIGILTTIVTVNVFKVKDDAKIKVAKMGIQSIKNALILRNKYPKSLDELAKDKSISGKLVDPWGRKYVYIPRYSDDGDTITSYIVYSCGPDGKKDTADDIGKPKTDND